MLTGNVYMIQATMRNGSKGMVYPATLRFPMNDKGKAFAYTVLCRYQASAKHGETYAMVVVNAMGRVP